MYHFQNKSYFTNDIKFVIGKLEGLIQPCPKVVVICYII